MDWKDYEIEIYEFFKSEYPNADVKHNVEIFGRYSGVKRQVDILIDDYVAGCKFSIAIDGKYFSSVIDVKDIESFIGMLGDIDVHKGLLITQKGYSKAAIDRANNDPFDIELDILNFEDLKHFQAFGALPYSKDIGVAIPAPFGWIIDGRTTEAYVATLYQQGLTLDEAINANEWMYINFWHKDDKCQNMEDLLELQEKNTLSHFPDAAIKHHRTINREKERTHLREIIVSTYPSIEYTGYVEFDDFILFCVLFTPREFERKNIRKLEYIMAKAVLLKIDAK